MKKKILITDNYTPSSLSWLSSQTELEIVKSLSIQPTKEELQSVEILLTRSQTQVNQHLLEMAYDLKMIVTATSGFDHIDLVACHKKSVQVAYTPEANAQSAAEHTMALILGLTKKIYQAHLAINNLKWKKSLVLNQELSQKTLGLVGFGQVGSRVARMAQAFGMEVVVHDPYNFAVHESPFEPLGLSELLRVSDLVSLHIPLTQKTYKLINKQTLPHFNSKALLINTSRGEVVDENELVLALEQKQLGGAALDVFIKEPLPEASKLRKRNDVLLSPHLGAYTEQALVKASRQAVKLAQAYLHSQPVDNLLQPNAERYSAPSS